MRFVIARQEDRRVELCQDGDLVAVVIHNGEEENIIAYLTEKGLQLVGGCDTKTTGMPVEKGFVKVIKE